MGNTNSIFVNNDEYKYIQYLGMQNGTATTENETVIFSCDTFQNDLVKYNRGNTDTVYTNNRDCLMTWGGSTTSQFTVDFLNFTDAPNSFIPYFKSSEAFVPNNHSGYGLSKQLYVSSFSKLYANFQLSYPSGTSNKQLFWLAITTPTKTNVVILQQYCNIYLESFSDTFHSSVNPTQAQGFNVQSYITLQYSYLKMNGNQPYTIWKGVKAPTGGDTTQYKFVCGYDQETRSMDDVLTTSNCSNFSNNNLISGYAIDNDYYHGIIFKQNQPEYSVTSFGLSTTGYNNGKIKSFGGDLLLRYCTHIQNKAYVRITGYSHYDYEGSFNLSATNPGSALSGNIPYTITIRSSNYFAPCMYTSDSHAYSSSQFFMTVNSQNLIEITSGWYGTDDVIFSWTVYPTVGPSQQRTSAKYTFQPRQHTEYGGGLPNTYEHTYKMIIRNFNITIVDTSSGYNSRTHWGPTDYETVIGSTINSSSVDLYAYYPRSVSLDASSFNYSWLNNNFARSGCIAKLSGTINPTGSATTTRSMLDACFNTNTTYYITLTYQINSVLYFQTYTLYNRTITPTDIIY